MYFHQQSPEHIQAEVSEYIITGGWNEDHPNYRRVPNGIHEQYVKLLKGIARELDKDGGLRSAQRLDIRLLWFR